MAIGFTTEVTAKDWDQTLGGWRCPALRIPGARIAGIFASGERIDDNWYEVMHDQAVINWTRGGDPPDEVCITITLTEELSTQTVTQKWKKLAILLPLITTLVTSIVAPILVPKFQGDPIDGNNGDELVAWQNSLSEELGDCIQNDSDADPSDCLQIGIRKFKPPLSRSTKPMTFYSDVRAGQLLISISQARRVLEEKLGIYHDSFIGTGYSIPWNSDYEQVRTREYLVPNLPESEENVWTWKLKPVVANLDRTIRDIVLNDDPTPSSNTISFERLKDDFEGRMQRAGNQPFVIRFAQFPEERYSGRVGRSQATRVFFIGLEEVWNMQIKDASEFSGHRFTPRDDDDTDVLFVWLYIPTHSDAVVLATWGNVFDNLSEWLN